MNERANNGGEAIAGSTTRRYGLQLLEPLV